MIKFSNGNKLYRFSTDGETVKLQVDTSTYFPKDLEFKLSDDLSGKRWRGLLPKGCRRYNVCRTH